MDTITYEDCHSQGEYSPLKKCHPRLYTESCIMPPYDGTKYYSAEHPSSNSVSWGGTSHYKQKSLSTINRYLGTPFGSASEGGINRTTPSHLYS